MGQSTYEMIDSYAGALSDINRHPLEALSWDVMSAAVRIINDRIKGAVCNV